MLKNNNNTHYAKVTNNIWIGDVYSIADNEFLKRENIGFIVNVSSYEVHNNLDIPTLTITGFTDSDFTYTDDIIKISDLDVNIYNKSKLNYISYLSKTARIVTTAIDQATKAGKNVLVHCSAGRNRSAFMIAAYLLIFEKHSVDDIIVMLTNANNTRMQPVLTNKFFRITLYDIELRIN